MPEPALHEQYSTIAQQERTYHLGMWAFLASEVLLFGTLFAAYAYYHVMYGHDFAEAIKDADLAKGTIDTFILATSTYTMTLSVLAIRKDNLPLAIAFTALTAGLALAFLTIEGTEWATDIAKGAVPGASYHYAKLPAFGAKMYFTVFYFLTGLHMFHVTMGFFLLCGLTVRLMMKAYSSRSHLPLELGTMYWHFVDVMWFFIYACMYLGRSA